MLQDVLAVLDENMPPDKDAMVMEKPHVMLSVKREDRKSVV